MGMVSAISWTDGTFNSWIGCSEVGAPCDFCYAREQDKRWQWGVPAAQRDPTKAPHWGHGAPRYRTSESNWRGPLKWNAAAQAAGVPMKVFANSLSDVFDNEVPQQWREDLFSLWRATPWLRWIIVTKRVPNITDMLPADWGAGYPNVGLVATTGDQKEFDRDALRLLSIPARWHGFSIEPQLGCVMLPDWVGDHDGSLWFILGGESRQRGAKRSDGLPIPEEPRPWNPDWAMSMIADSLQWSNTFVFVKQTGARPIGLLPPEDGMGKDPAMWPKDIRVQEFPPELLS